MHPNLFLRTFWRSDLRRAVFVAMSFDEPYQRRFSDVIEPAIRDNSLTAVRADLSKTGDSILTDIIDGIAHSVMVLADVSVVGHDSKTGLSYRNGNVMYEVGLALACRQSAEVLLIRDDKDRFLFDVSTIPHKHLDFTDTMRAKESLAVEIAARLREINRIHDARIEMAVASLTAHERQILGSFAMYSMEQQFWLINPDSIGLSALGRLLDKQLIRTWGITHEGYAMFRWTELGRSLTDSIDRHVPIIRFPPIPAAATEKPPNTTDGSN